jgi:hypothetical protein
VSNNRSPVNPPPPEPITDDDLRIVIRRVRLLAIIARLSDAVTAGRQLTRPELDALADLCDRAAMPEEAALVRSWLPDAAIEDWCARHGPVRRIM